LVAGVADHFRRLGVALGDPARDEERGAQLLGVEQLEDARHRDPRAVDALGDDARAVLHRRVAGEPAGLGVEVERQTGGAAGAAGEDRLVLLVRGHAGRLAERGVPSGRGERRTLCGEAVAPGHHRLDLLGPSLEVIAHVDALLFVRVGPRDQADGWLAREVGWQVRHARGDVQEVAGLPDAVLGQSFAVPRVDPPAERVDRRLVAVVLVRAGPLPGRHG